MSDYAQNFTTDAWGLWAPGLGQHGGGGWVAGTVGQTRDDAQMMHEDRVANGDAFEGEGLRRVKVRVSVTREGVASALVL